jgi:hypothetical protein
MAFYPGRLTKDFQSALSEAPSCCVAVPAGVHRQKTSLDVGADSSMLIDLGKPPRSSGE